MEIDLLAEKRLSMTELARLQNVTVPTIWRWRQKGVAGGVRLETFMVGGRRFTTEQAFCRFIERTTAAANGDQPTSRSNRQRNTSISRAENELTEAGI